MAAGAGRDRDQAVGAFLDRLAGEAVVDDVVEGDAAPGVDRVVHLDERAQRGDHDRHPPFGAGRHVLLQPIVGAMDDLVDREGGRRPVRIVPVPRCQFLGDAVQPFVQLRLRTGVEGREGADDPRLALGDHQIGVGHDEERRADHRQAKAGEGRGQGHVLSLAEPPRRSKRRRNERSGRAPARKPASTPADRAIERPRG